MKSFLSVGVIAAALAARMTVAVAAPTPTAADQVSITSPSGGAIGKTKIDITVAFATDASGKGGGNVSTVELLANGSVAASFDNPPQVKSGTHTFAAVDLTPYLKAGGSVTLVARAFHGNVKAGNYVDSAPVNLVVDTTPPAITSLVPASGSFSNNPRPSLSAQVTDSGGSGVDPASVVLRLNGTALPAVVTLANPNSAAVTYTPPQPLAQGTYTVTVDAKDKAGNAAQTASSTWVLDLTPPVATILAPASGSFTNSPGPGASGTVIDTGGSGIDPSSVVVKVDGVAGTPTVVLSNPNTASVSFTPGGPLAQGMHTVTLDARDRAGNSAPTASSTFLVDLTPPVALITGPTPGSFTKNAQPPLSASVTDSGGSGVDASSVTLQLDGTPVTATVSLSDPNTASVSFVPPSPLPEGAHVYTLRARDRAANSSATAVSNFTIDLTSPVLAILPADGSRVQGPSPAASVSYSDGLSGVDLSTLKITLDGTDVTAAFAAGASQATWGATSALADGPHVFRVQLSDKAGNLAQASSLFRSDSGLGTVGAQGGTVAVPPSGGTSAGAALVIPAGALPQNTTFFIEAVIAPPPFPPGYTSVGPVLDFGPSTVFSQPVTIKVPYDPALAAAAGVPPSGLRLLTFDVGSGLWILVPVLSVDPVNHLLVAEITALNGQQFGVAAPTVSPTQTLVGAPSGGVVADGLSFTTLTVTPEASDGSVIGPNETVTATVTGLGTPIVQVVDLGNGVYQIIISSSSAGTGQVTITVNGVTLPVQTVTFTPVPSSFAVTGFTTPLQAGIPSNVTLRALDQNGNILTSFIGSVELDLTGTRDASENLIYPDSFVATFGASDSGQIILPGALVFAQAGPQQVKVLYLLKPASSGSAAVQVTAGPPALLTKVGGDNQSGAAGSTLPQPLAVRVTDLFGNPVSGVQVRFNVQTGSASFVQ